MQVIILRIPAKTTLNEVLEFGLSCFKIWLPMQKGPEIDRYEILEIYDEESGTTEYHGLLRFPQEKEARKAIDRLNGKKLHGAIVQVREYVYRSPGDRRVDKRAQGLNRPEDRRRTALQVSERSKAAKSKGYAHLSRTFGG
jgi:hypothetical protein